MWHAQPSLQRDLFCHRPVHSLPNMSWGSSRGVGAGAGASCWHRQLLKGSSVQGSANGESIGQDWVQTAQLLPQRPSSAPQLSVPKVNSVGSGLSISHRHLDYGSEGEKTEFDGQDILQETQWTSEQS